jgi:hypothetical protein
MYILGLSSVIALNGARLEAFQSPNPEGSCGVLAILSFGFIGKMLKVILGCC